MVSTTASTDMPARSGGAAGVASSTILTGRRCAILVKLPVALLGATGDRLRPVAGAMLCTVPRSRRSG